MSAYYQDTPGVSFVAIQTAFEGFGTNTVASARQAGKRYKLTIPIGHSGSSEQPSQFMRRYRTGGTPWTIIIDRAGKVRFNGFGIGPASAVKLIDRLLVEEGPAPGVRRAGLAKFKFDEWIDVQRKERNGKRRLSRAVLYGWYKEQDRAGLTRLEGLRRRHRGLDVVVVYTGKSHLDKQAIMDMVRSTEYRGAFALDRDGSEGRRVLSAAPEQGKGLVRVLVDANGRIRYMERIVRADTKVGDDSKLSRVIERLLDKPGESRRQSSVR